jgi:hypothetical protein
LERTTDQVDQAIDDAVLFVHSLMEKAEAA